MNKQEKRKGKMKLFSIYFLFYAHLFVSLPSRQSFEHGNIDQNAVGSTECSVSAAGRSGRDEQTVKGGAHEYSILTDYEQI